MMNETPIAVIMPVYNREKYVAEAIDSVLAQSYPIREFIVVDDGSVDDSATIIRAYEPRLRYVYQANQGIAGARNTGIVTSTSDWLAFLDSDDIWEPDKLAKQSAVLAAKPKTDIIFGHARQFVSPELASSLDAEFGVDDEAMPAQIASAMLARREVFDRAGLYDTSLPLSVDMEWYMRIADHDFNIVMLPDVVYRRRIHNSNINRDEALSSAVRLRVLKAALDRRRRRAGAVE